MQIIKILQEARQGKPLLPAIRSLPQHSKSNPWKLYAAAKERDGSVLSRKRRVPQFFQLAGKLLDDFIEGMACGEAASYTKPSQDKELFQKADDRRFLTI